MSCGTPVVATNAGGIREVVEHEETGLLSAVDDLDGFARNLAALLFDKERARRMGETGRRHAVERFRRDKIVGEYESVYRRVLAAAE
jgi:glycosyltransferase involved in cell wall biosynthesis